MYKLSIRHFPLIKRISRREKVNEDAIIEHMKKCVKKDPAVIQKFKEYNVPVDKIDDVFVKFDDLDVSAKTKNRKIYLNRKMLGPDSEIKDPTHYLAHELTHWLQQICNNTQGHAVEDYLSKPTEEEAFQVQIDFKERNEGEREADRYVEELLDHHDKTGKEREKIKEKLTEND